MKHRHVKSTSTQPNQGQPLRPTKPRITPNETTSPKSWTTYLRCVFQSHSICKSFLPQKMFLAPHILLKPWSRAIAEKLLILICLITHFHAALAYMMSSSQMWCLALDSCHCSFLNTLSFHSIQMIHKVMPVKEVPNNKGFAKVLPNPFPNHSLFSMKLVIVICTFDVTTSFKTSGFTSPVQEGLVYENLSFRACVWLLINIGRFHFP